MPDADGGPTAPHKPANGTADPAAAHQAHEPITHEKPAEAIATHPGTVPTVHDAVPFEKAAGTVPTEAPAAAQRSHGDAAPGTGAETSVEPAAEAASNVQDDHDPMDTDAPDVERNGVEDAVPGHIATVERVPLFSWGSDSAPAPPSVDSDSSVRDDVSMSSYKGSSTASINSSIYNFVEEGGRTFHRYKQGKYHLPNDLQEQDRLDLQHAIYLMTTGGRLHLAPITSDVKEVLDIGTGTGIWAIEFAQKYPEAQVLGTDLSPIQPEYVPENCQFEIDDADDDWVFNKKFDFIHARALVSCFSDQKKVIQSCFDNLTPGGWSEWQDFIFPGRYLGEAPPDATIVKWSELIVEAGRKVGRNWDGPGKYKQYFEEVGFTNVVEKRFFWPAGTWARGDYYKSIGAYFVADINGALDILSQKLLAVLGLSKEEIEGLCQGFRNDIDNPRVHAYFPITFVYGQKPLSPEQTNRAPPTVSAPETSTGQVV